MLCRTGMFGNRDAHARFVFKLSRSWTYRAKAPPFVFFQTAILIPLLLGYEAGG